MTLPIAYFIVSDSVQRTVKYAHTTYTKAKISKQAQYGTLFSNCKLAHS